MWMITKEKLERGARQAAGMIKAAFEKFGKGGPITDQLTDLKKMEGEIRGKLEGENELDKKRMERLLKLAKDTDMEGAYETAMNICKKYLAIGPKDRTPDNEEYLKVVQEYSAFKAVLENWK